eukprot:g1969.t1
MSLRSLSSSVSYYGSGILRTVPQYSTGRIGSARRTTPVETTAALPKGSASSVSPILSLHRRQDLSRSRAASPECLELDPESKQLPVEEDSASPRFPESNQRLPFTISELRQAIPKHCFERSTLRSLSYFFGDILAIIALVYASTFIDPLPVASVIKYTVLWPMYWYTVGVFGVGLWIVSHECGHGAFSEHNWLNDLVGFIGHSVLFVPYFSWKHSHRRHHANTGSLTSDEVYIPNVRNEVLDEEPLFSLHSTAPARFVTLLSLLFFGFPLYLIMGLGGPKYEGWPNHFNPWSSVFLPKERFEVFLSDLGLAAVVGGLCVVGHYFGFATVLKTYIIPYFVVHFWLVLITFLHHTNPICPHYDDKEWEWLKGALSTIDRRFGILDVMFHRITDTHVLHHLFAQIPHYHAKEATEAIKPILGPYYKVDTRNWVQAVWEDFRDTKYVAPDRAGEGVMWYRS